jgi:hypothetical protein
MAAEQSSALGQGAEFSHVHSSGICPDCRGFGWVQWAHWPRTPCLACKTAPTEERRRTPRGHVRQGPIAKRGVVPLGASVEQIRHANFVAVVSQFSLMEASAQWLGVSPAYLREIKNRSRSEGRPKEVGEAIARRVETKLGVEAGWLDRPLLDRDVVAALGRELHEWISSRESAAPSFESQSRVSGVPACRAAATWGASITDVRHGNFTALLEQFSTMCEFGAWIGISRNYVQMIKNRHPLKHGPKEVPEGIARRIEIQLGVVAGWLDEPQPLEAVMRTRGGLTSQAILI